MLNKLNTLMSNPLLGAAPAAGWEQAPSLVDPRPLGNALKHLPLTQPANEPDTLPRKIDLDGILMPSEYECPMSKDGLRRFGNRAPSEHECPVRADGPGFLGNGPAVDGDDEVPAPVQTALEMLHGMSTFEILRALRDGSLPEEILSDPEAMAVVEERVSSLETMIDFIIHLLEAGKAAKELISLLRGR